MKHKQIIAFAIVILGCLFSNSASAHGVDGATKNFLVENNGASFMPFLYIGAKHMLTGYDHLLFLVGVVFFLFKPKEVLLYVSFFTLGHSTTLLLGVWWNIGLNAYLIDAIIALSIVYKAIDNMGGLKLLFGKQPNTKAAVLIFGLFHGFGLATKIQEFGLSRDGLFTNLIGFNIGVELGQFLALTLVLILLSAWRHSKSFMKFSLITNTILMTAGFVLLGFQLTGYFKS